MTELIEAELRRHLEQWADAEIPPLPDLASLEQVGRQRMVRRRGWIAAAAAAVVVLVAVTCLSWALRDANRMEPTPPVDTPTDTGMTNGRIVSAEKYFAEARSFCKQFLSDHCGELTAFDQDSGTGLLATLEPVENVVSILTVADPEAQLAELTCPRDFACLPNFWDGGASSSPTLGPGADEITLLSDDQSVQVLGYDGSVHETLDLSATLGDNEAIGALAWSADRTRLAVDTSEAVAGELVARVWLFDRDGGNGQLVYTATFPHSDGEHPLSYLWGLTWSPDGTRIGVVEEHEVRHNLTYESRWQGVVLLKLAAAGQTGSATPQTLYEYPHHWHSAQIAWSPDGTRLAATIGDGVLELSAADGRELARHPRLDGTIIWLQGRR